MKKHEKAIFVKPQQWPTPSESIAIYCVRKLVSCITHLQSCAKVDIWNKKKKLHTVAKIKPQGYKNWRLPKFSTTITPPLNTATTLFNKPRSQRPFGTSDWQNYSSRLAWLLSQAVTRFATDRNVQRKKSSFAKVKWSNSIKINIAEWYVQAESLQGDGSKTRQEIPQTAGWKA